MEQQHTESPDSIEQRPEPTNQHESFASIPTAREAVAELSEHNNENHPHTLTQSNESSKFVYKRRLYTVSSSKRQFDSPASGGDSNVSKKALVTNAPTLIEQVATADIFNIPLPSEDHQDQQLFFNDKQQHSELRMQDQQRYHSQLGQSFSSNVSATEEKLFFSQNGGGGAVVGKPSHRRHESSFDMHKEDEITLRQAHSATQMHLLASESLNLIPSSALRKDSTNVDSPIIAARILEVAQEQSNEATGIIMTTAPTASTPTRGSYNKQMHIPSSTHFRRKSLIAKPQQRTPTLSHQSSSEYQQQPANIPTTTATSTLKLTQSIESNTLPTATTTSTPVQHNIHIKSNMQSPLNQHTAPSKGAIQLNKRTPLIARKQSSQQTRQISRPIQQQQQQYQERKPPMPPSQAEDLTTGTLVANSQLLSEQRIQPTLPSQESFSLIRTLHTDQDEPDFFGNENNQISGNDFQNNDDSDDDDDDDDDDDGIIHSANTYLHQEKKHTGKPHKHIQKNPQNILRFEQVGISDDSDTGADRADSEISGIIDVSAGHIHSLHPQNKHSMKAFTQLDPSASPNQKYLLHFTDLPVVEESSIASSEVKELPLPQEIRAEIESNYTNASNNKNNNNNNSNAHSNNGSNHPGLIASTISKLSKQQQQQNESYRLEGKRNTQHSMISNPQETISHHPNQSQSQTISEVNVPPVINNNSKSQISNQKDDNNNTSPNQQQPQLQHQQQNDQQFFQQDQVHESENEKTEQQPQIVHSILVSGGATTLLEYNQFESVNSNNGNGSNSNNNNNNNNNNNINIGSGTDGGIAAVGVSLDQTANNSQTLHQSSVSSYDNRKNKFTRESSSSNSTTIKQPRQQHSSQESTNNSQETVQLNRAPGNNTNSMSFKLRGGGFKTRQEIQGESPETIAYARNINDQFISELQFYEEAQRKLSQIQTQYTESMSQQQQQQQNQQHQHQLQYYRQQQQQHNDIMFSQENNNWGRESLHFSEGDRMYWPEGSTPGSADHMHAHKNSRFQQNNYHELSAANRRGAVESVNKNNHPTQIEKDLRLIQLDLTNASNHSHIMNPGQAAAHSQQKKQQKSEDFSDQLLNRINSGLEHSVEDCSPAEHTHTHTHLHDRDIQFTKASANVEKTINISNNPAHGSITQQQQQQYYSNSQEPNQNSQQQKQNQQLQTKGIMITFSDTQKQISSGLLHHDPINRSLHKPQEVLTLDKNNHNSNKQNLEQQSQQEQQPQQLLNNNNNKQEQQQSALSALPSQEQSDFQESWGGFIEEDEVKNKLKRSTCWQRFLRCLPRTLTPLQCDEKELILRLFNERFDIHNEMHCTLIAKVRFSYHKFITQTSYYSQPISHAAAAAAPTAATRATTRTSAAPVSATPKNQLLLFDAQTSNNNMSGGPAIPAEVRPGKSFPQLMKSATIDMIQQPDKEPPAQTFAANIPEQPSQNQATGFMRAPRQQHSHQRRRTTRITSIDEFFSSKVHVPLGELHILPLLQILAFVESQVSASHGIMQEVAYRMFFRKIHLMYFFISLSQLFVQKLSESDAIDKCVRRLRVTTIMELLNALFLTMFFSAVNPELNQDLGSSEATVNLYNQVNRISESLRTPEDIIAFLASSPHTSLAKHFSSTTTANAHQYLQQSSL